MAHEIDMSNNRANIAYVGETPWHGLGTELQPGQTIEEWKIAAGLNWTIEKAPVQFTVPADLYGQGVGTAVQTFPDKSVLYRSDTKTPLSVMSDSRYHIVQPGEIIEFYRDLIDSSRFTLETAGCLKGGAKVWALAKSNLEIRIQGQDLIKPYLLLSSSCDGTMSTVADLTSVRVVCQNTLSMAVGSDGQNATLRIPHATKLNHAAIKRELGLLDDAVENFATSVDKLAETRVGTAEAVNWFAELYAKKDETGQLLNAPTLEKTVNKLMELWTAGPGADLRSSKGTAWGLVNAITRYQDFDARAQSSESRFNSSQYGQGKLTKAKAFAAALELAA